MNTTQHQTKSTTASTYRNCNLTFRCTSVHNYYKIQFTTAACAQTAFYHLSPRKKFIQPRSRSSLLKQSPASQSCIVTQTLSLDFLKLMKCLAPLARIDHIFVPRPDGGPKLLPLHLPLLFRSRVLLVWIAERRLKNVRRNHSARWGIRVSVQYRHLTHRSISRLSWNPLCIENTLQDRILDGARATMARNGFFRRESHH